MTAATLALPLPAPVRRRRPPARAILAALALPLLLAACAAPPKGGDDGQTAAAGPPVKRPPAPTKAELMGRPQPVVRTALGTPALTRSEPPAEMWQYGTKDCVLDVIYYPDARAGGPAVAYLESRAMDGAGLEVDVCLRSIAAGAR